LLRVRSAAADAQPAAAFRSQVSAALQRQQGCGNSESLGQPLHRDAIIMSRDSDCCRASMLVYTCHHTLERPLHAPPIVLIPFLVFKTDCKNRFRLLSPIGAQWGVRSGGVREEKMGEDDVCGTPHNTLLWQNCPCCSILKRSIIHLLHD
jgi:hypothetical protein